MCRRVCADSVHCHIRISDRRGDFLVGHPSGAHCTGGHWRCCGWLLPSRLLHQTGLHKVSPGLLSPTLFEPGSAVLLYETTSFECLQWDLLACKHAICPTLHQYLDAAEVLHVLAFEPNIASRQVCQHARVVPLC